METQTLSVSTEALHLVKLVEVYQDPVFQMLHFGINRTNQKHYSRIQWLVGEGQGHVALILKTLRDTIITQLRKHVQIHFTPSIPFPTTTTVTNKEHELINLNVRIAMLHHDKAAVVAWLWEEVVVLLNASYSASFLPMWMPYLLLHIMFYQCRSQWLNYYLVHDCPGEKSNVNYLCLKKMWKPGSNHQTVKILKRDMMF